MPGGPGRSTPSPDEHGSDIRLLERALHATADTLEVLLEGLNEIKLTVNTIKTRAETSGDEI